LNGRRRGMSVIEHNNTCVYTDKPLKVAYGLAFVIGINGGRRGRPSGVAAISAWIGSLIGCRQKHECRPLSGQGKVAVSLSINWDDPLLDVPEQRTVEIAGRRVELPVMTARERAAEKARAFLTRGEAADAHDLYYYGSVVLTAPDRRRLPDLIRRKLQRSRLPDTDLHVRWDEMAVLAEASYARGEGLLLVATKAPWPVVQRQLRRFKAAVPERM